MIPYHGSGIGQEVIPIKKKGKFEAGRTARPTASSRSTPKKNTAQKSAAKASGKKSGAAAKKIVIIAACALLVVVLGLFAYGSALKNSDKIYPNVYIAGVDVGGLKRDAAVSVVSDAVKENYAGDTLHVILPDRELELTPDVTQIALNPEEAVDEAMRYGRTGGAFSALIHYMKAKNTEYTVSLESSLNLDTEEIHALIEQTAREVESDRIEATIEVDEDAKQIVVHTGSPATSLNVEGLYSAVLERFATGDLTDLEYSYDAEPVTPVDLQEYYDKYCSETKDAYYDGEKKELVKEVNGYGFDVQHYQQELAMAEPNSTVTIQVEPIEPEVTLEELEKVYFADVLGSCDSVHTNNAGRTRNLELACEAINGTILNPGEEFSFNKIVGERTPEKGYQPAIVYVTGGASESETGGGVCQVASTIYTSCLYANLAITERAPHMYLVTYVQAGMDATIYWGSLDFKFKNSTEYPIRIDASVSGGYCHVKLVGTKPENMDYDHIVLRHDTINTKYPKTVGEDDKEITIVKGGGVDENGNAIDIAINADGEYFVLGAVKETSYTGYTVVAYRDFVDKDGKVLKTETLHTDVYNSRDTKYELTPYTVPEPDPEPDPDDPDTSDPDDPNAGGDPGWDPDWNDGWDPNWGIGGNLWD